MLENDGNVDPEQAPIGPLYIFDFDNLDPVDMHIYEMVFNSFNQ